MADGPQWLLELDQTHCAFPALCYFPETTAEHSWVASVGALLDTGALLLSGGPATLPPRRPATARARCWRWPTACRPSSRSGRAAGLPIDPPVTLMSLLPDESRPPPDISVTRAEFEAGLDRLVDVVPVAAGDRDTAWHRFAWVRSAYDPALRGLAGLTMAVPAPWTTDRPATVGRPRLVTNHPLRVDWSLPGGS